MKIKSILPVALLTLVVFVIICLTFQDYGVTWDEEVHKNYGDMILRWFRTFFQDSAALNYRDLFYYGGFFDVTAQLASSISPFGVYETRHFVGALFGLWAIFIAFRLAKFVSGTTAGFFAAIFLLLHPAFYGHMFNNPKDIPFASLFLTTIYYLASTYDSLPHLHFKDLFKLGCSLGLTLAIRVGGLVFLLISMILCWRIWMFSRFRQDKAYVKQNRKGIERDFSRNAIWVFAIAWPLMLLWWPWGLQNPLMNPLKALAEATNKQWLSSPVLFEGIYYPSLEVPRRYLSKLILLTVPEFILIVLLVGCLLALHWFIRKPVITEKVTKIVFLLLAFVVPVLATTVLRSAQYDGIRHFLFVIPLLAVLGGISLAGFLRSGAWILLRIVVSIAICISLAMTVVDMVRLHPYQTIYFNRSLAGGLRQAAHNYETDYWGNSYKEGIEWITNNYKPDLNRKIRVNNPNNNFLTDYYLKKTPALRTRYETVDDNPDLFLSTTRWNLYKTFSGRLLHVVERERVPLLYIIEVVQPTNQPWF